MTMKNSNDTFMIIFSLIVHGIVVRKINNIFPTIMSFMRCRGESIVQTDRRREEDNRAA